MQRRFALLKKALASTGGFPTFSRSGAIAVLIEVEIDSGRSF
jgi:hypothetical protein